MYYPIQNRNVFKFRYLNYILESDNGPIRSQDYNDVIISISSTPIGLNVLIDFLVDKLAFITKNMFEGDALVSFMYATCASKAALDSEILKVIYKYATLYFCLFNFIRKLIEL